MFIADQARETPDKTAIIIAETGARISYRELDDRSNQAAQYLHAQGLRRGDHIAVLMENNLRFMEVVWAAFRSGLYLTAVNRYLPPEDAAYIVNDCMAKAIFTSYDRRETAAALSDLIPNCRLRLMVDGTIDGWEAYESAIARCPATPVEPQWMGVSMLYSSGTTGRPKGILRPLPEMTVDQGFGLRQGMNRYGFSSDTVYLSPAPLYHAAPLGYVTNVLGFGGTVVMMQHFDAENALKFVEQYRITHSQWVPTMFVRMLKLNAAVRAAYDLSSHRAAVHAAAPCPVDVKRQMIEWWGPIIHEYYAGTEGTGATIVDSDDWMAHPGSVGRAALGILHICDEEGAELPTGEAGLIYFEREQRTFAYHNDPAKTRAAQHPVHDNWMSLGDVGYVDDEGYLYLTDRKAFMIISGGVNIYPQAIEDALILHPKVGDVAVFGVPNDEMGEEVKAVIEPAPGEAAGDDLAAELMAFAREHLAHYMAPRSIDFIDEMPRLPTGKLYKRLLKDQYWQAAGAGDLKERAMMDYDGRGLVSTDWLAAHLSDPDLRVFDVTVHLRPASPGPYTIESGQDDYEAGHVPGAAFLDLGRDLSDPDARLPFTKPSPERLASALGAAGVGPQSLVVAYSTPTPMWATRLWWLLRAAGFDNASVLDGGLAKWKAEGRPLETGARRYPPAQLTLAERPEAWADKDAVLAAIADGGVCTINALSPSVHSGESATNYGRKGHIAGSRNVPYAALTRPDGTYRDDAELRALFDGVGAFERPRAICYCGGGISATMDALALTRLGHRSVAVYDGSMSEWSRDDSLPMETGA